MCVLWNVASLMSQVAAAQDDDDTGTKQATAFYQKAAGIFCYIREYMAGVLNKVIIIIIQKYSTFFHISKP